jgi:hypothetical protein
MVVIVLGIVGLVWYTMTVAVYGPRLVSGSAGGAIFAAIVLLVFNTLVRQGTPSAPYPPTQWQCRIWLRVSSKQGRQRHAPVCNHPSNPHACR